MRYHVLRLKPNQDLRKEIVSYCHSNGIQAGCIVTCVGSLREVCLRKADGKSLFKVQKEYEIVSLEGVIAANGLHLHISLADVDLMTIGGHLLEGNLINTTAEIVILTLDDYDLSREADEETGYDELVVRGRNNDEKENQS